MNATTIHEAESVTRSIARWGSAAAVIIFGVAFVTDKMLTWDIVSGQAVQIALISATFAGYALAWTTRFEVLGSVIALVSMIAVFVVYGVKYDAPPNLFFLAIGAPAAFHLVAVMLHRYQRTRGQT
jgi:hypothetical protein